MNELLSKQQILDRGSAYIPICGIYFLIDESEIVYVGQAKDIWTRLVPYWRGDKQFAKFAYIECNESDLSDLEAEYIVSFMPRYNISLPPNSKWTTLFLVRRRAHEMGINFTRVKRYMREKKICSINEYYRISD